MGNRAMLAITLVGIGSLLSQTAPRHLVTVRDLKITRSPENEGHEMKEDVVFVKFEAILRNKSDHTIFVSPESLMSAIPEFLLPSGEWKLMLLSRDRFETARPRYPGCTRVEPGKTFTFPEVTDMIVLRRDRPASETVNVRVNFYTVCMVGSATRTTDFVTEAIQIIASPP